MPSRGDSPDLWQGYGDCCCAHRAIIYKKDHATITFPAATRARSCNGGHDDIDPSGRCRFGSHAKPLFLLKLCDLAFAVYNALKPFVRTNF